MNAFPLPTGVQPHGTLLLLLIGALSMSAWRHTTTWWTARRTPWPVHALTALLGALFATTMVGLDRATSVEEAQRWFNLRTGFGLAGMALHLWSCRELSGLNWPRLLPATGGLLLLAAGLALGGVPFSGQIDHIERVVLPWGEPMQVMRHGVVAGLSVGLLALLLLVVAFGLAAARQLATRDRLGGLLLGAATTTISACSVLISATEVSGSPAPWLGSLAFALWIALVDQLVARQELQRSIHAELSRDRLDSAMAASPMGFSIVSTTGRWESVNPAFEAMTGYPREQLLRMTFMDITHPDDRPESERARIGLLAGTQAKVSMEKRYRRADGTWIWAHVTVTLLRNPDGSPRHFISQFQDITERRQREDRLREQEAQLRNLTDNLPNTVTYQLIQAPDGKRRFTFVSRAVERLNGISVEAALADPMALLEQVLPEERRPIAAVERQAIARQSPFDHVTRIRRPDGAIRWVRLTAAPRPQPDGSTIWDGAEIDVTREHEAELALRENESRLRGLTDNLPHAVTYQLITPPEGGRRFLHVSEAVERLHGVTVDEVLANPDALYGQVLAEDVAGLAAAEQRSFDTLKVFEATVRMRARDGRVRWMRLASAPRRLPDGTVLWDGVETDITAEHEAALELRRTTALLAAVVATTGDAVVTCDAEGCVQEFNSAAERLFGRPAAEVTGRNVQLLLGPETRAQYPERLAGQLAAPLATPTRRPFQGLRKDGSLFDAEISVSAWFQEGKRQLVGVIRDLTEQKRLEARLQQQRQLELVGQLAGGIAHDFNNLLTVIRTAAELVASEVAGAPAAEDVEAIRAASERAAALTAQLLTFARRGAHTAQRIDLDAQLAAEAEMLRRALNDDVSLELQLAAEGCHVDADPTQLGQLLANLVLNARDAMPTGGRIAVSTRTVAVDAALRSRWPGAPSEGEVCLELAVADGGIGMSPEVMARAFEPFFTTKAPNRGTGLGLAVVFGIVEQSRGHIGLESAVGVGTTFRIWLPRADVPSPAPALGLPPAPRPAVRRSPRSSSCVLVVEDEPALRATLEQALRRAGHVVLTAGDVPTALALALGHPSSIDLLLTDVVMPGRSGLELADSLKFIRPATPVLFMSGYTDDTVLQHGIARGEVRFLAKPFSAAEVVSAVERELERSVPAGAETAPPLH